jgi:hypothetical protein
MYSTDGSTWNSVQAFRSATGISTNAVYENGMWVVTGSNDASFNNFMYSTDGSTWNSVQAFRAANGFSTNAVYGAPTTTTTTPPTTTTTTAPTTTTTTNPTTTTTTPTTTTPTAPTTTTTPPTTTTIPPPCFVKGSRVLTPSGYKKIEDLESGAPILTADNRIVPIKLYSYTIEKATTETAPYKIQVGALGANIPSADLHVSPRHAVKDSKGRWQIPKYLSQKYLGKKATQYGVGEPVTYYHIECPNYYTDNVIVEGTVVESFKNNQGLLGVTYIWDYKEGGWLRVPPNKTIEVPKKPSTYMIYSY